MQSFNEASKVLGIIYDYRAYTAKNGCITYARGAKGLGANVVWGRDRKRDT